MVLKCTLCFSTRRKYGLIVKYYFLIQKNTGPFIFLLILLHYTALLEEGLRKVFEKVWLEIVNRWVCMYVWSLLKGTIDNVHLFMLFSLFY